MFARSALFALALVVVGCSKPQTPVQIHEPVGAKAAAVEAPVVASDKPESLPAGQLDPAEFAHVVQDEGSTYVVLSAKPDTEHWASGDPALVSKESTVIARRDVDMAQLPKVLTRLTGQSMRLVGEKGEVCQGTLAKPFLMGRVVPHFGERSRWDGEEDDNGNKTPALSAARVAEIAWDMASDGKLLVAELVQTTGDCQDARFARAADLQPLPMTAARRPSATLASQALAALRKLPAYEAIEQSYRASSQAKPSVSWTESPSADVTMHEFTMGTAMYVWVSAFGGELCSDFSGQMNVLWKVSGTNAKKYEFEAIYQGDAEFSPSMLVKLPGDEVPSLLGRESMLRKDANGYEVDDLHVPFLDCPC